MYYGARHPDGTRGKPHYARARTDGTRWTFEYGDDGDDGEPQVTTGAVQEGPDGVIEIAIPPVHAGQGDTMIFVHARTFVRDPAVVSGKTTEGAPDSRDPSEFAYGADFLAEPCAEPKPEPEPEPEPERRPEPEPSTGSQPASPPSSSSPPAEHPPGSEPARLKVTAPRLRARSLRRARSFRVEVDPSAPLGPVVATLRKGGRTYARGRRASLRRAGSVKVAIRRRIGRGTYRLRLTGRTPEGDTVARSVTVRVT